MKPFIEITRTSGPICVELPSRRVVEGYNPSNMKLSIHREGARTLLANYPARQEDGGKMCFIIDDDLVEAHPGWYIGTVYNCNKPIHSMRMSIPRPRFGAASVQRMKPDCAPIVIEECKPEGCAEEFVVAEGNMYITA